MRPQLQEVMKDRIAELERRNSADKKAHTKEVASLKRQHSKAIAKLRKRNAKLEAEAKELKLPPGDEGLGGGSD